VQQLAGRGLALGVTAAGVTGAFNPERSDFRVSDLVSGKMCSVAGLCASVLATGMAGAFYPSTPELQSLGTSWLDVLNVLRECVACQSVTAAGWQGPGAGRDSSRA
jgi:hypothetical protein